MVLFLSCEPLLFRYMSEGLYNWLTTTLSRANSFVVEYDMLSSKCFSLTVVIVVIFK